MKHLRWAAVGIGMLSCCHRGRAAEPYTTEIPSNTPTQVPWDFEGFSSEPLETTPLFIGEREVKSVARDVEVRMAWGKLCSSYGALDCIPGFVVSVMNLASEVIYIERDGLHWVGHDRPSFGGVAIELFRSTSTEVDSMPLMPGVAMHFTGTLAWYFGGEPSACVRHGALRLAQGLMRGLMETTFSVENGFETYTSIRLDKEVIARTPTLHLAPGDFLCVEQD